MRNLGRFCRWTSSQYMQCIKVKDAKNRLTKEVTFLGKSYGEQNKVEKPDLIAISYEGSDDEEVLIVLDNYSSSKNENLDRILVVTMRKKKKFWGKYLKKKLKSPPNTTPNQKEVKVTKYWNKRKKASREI